MARYISFADAAGVARMGLVSGEMVVPLSTREEFFADPYDPATTRQTGDPLALASLTQLAPVPPTSRIFCLGINYRSHAAEAKELIGLDEPTVPMIFGRWPSTLVVSGTDIPLPHSEGLDWEVELAVVMGRQTWLQDERTADEAILGYTVFNDLSAREKQGATTQFTLGKNADASGPIGPAIVTPDELPSPLHLDLWTRVNGEIVQSSNTRNLIHSVPRVIAYISDTITLLPGDVIATGTPSGVGASFKPPRALQDGDLVEVGIADIGTISNRVYARK